MDTRNSRPSMASGSGVAVNSASASRVVRPEAVAPAAFWEPPSLADSSGLLPFLRKKSNTAEPFTGVVG